MVTEFSAICAPKPALEVAGLLIYQRVLGKVRWMEPEKSEKQEDFAQFEEDPQVPATARFRSRQLHSGFVAQILVVFSLYVNTS